MRHEARLFPLLLLLLFAARPQRWVNGQVPGLSPPPSNTPPEQRCVLAGHVSNAQTGEPVRKAAIRLQSRNSGAGGNVGRGAPTFQGYSATSDAAGYFRIESIEPGDYNLSGARNGFIDTQYGSKGPASPGTSITLRPSQQISDIALALTPQAVMSGKVIDEDGDPINGVMIQVLFRQWVRGKQRFLPRNGANTNDLGEFRIANLSAGKYYLSAQAMNHGGLTNSEPGKADVRPVRTYYPEAVTRESATPIDVKAGQDLAGINIRMHSAQTFHVRGKVVGAMTDGESGRESVSLGSRDDDSPLYFGGQSGVAKDHSFDIAGIAPGSYNLNVVMMSGEVRVTAHQQVDVGAADVNDVLLTVLPAGTISGQLHVEGTAPTGASAANLENLHVNLTPAENGMMFFGSRGHEVNADGTFALRGVSPGVYYVSVNNPDGTYTKSIRYGQQEILGKELDLSGSASGELTIVFRYGVAEIDGTVQSSSAESAATSGRVVLVPDQLNADGSGLHYASIDSGGSFTAKQIAPGHYHAYAFEQVEGSLLENPDLLKELASRGVDVEVKENDKKQIQVPLISAVDLQQITARLGIESQ